MNKSENDNMRAAATSDDPGDGLCRCLPPHILFPADAVAYLILCVIRIMMLFASCLFQTKTFGQMICNNDIHTMSAFAFTRHTRTNNNNSFCPNFCYWK